MSWPGDGLWESKRGQGQATTKQDEVIRVFQVWKAARTMIANKTSVKITLSLSRTPEIIGQDKGLISYNFSVHGYQMSSLFTSSVIRISNLHNFGECESACDPSIRQSLALHSPPV
ncbi:hypothetical protein NC651_023433 [Populus alba x Populus x berolinensis]|nr:hypothetical protein NC651_023433 [Populus alba x Populus x berolinensis]